MAQMRKHPRFDLNVADGFRFRPVGEFHATHGKKFMILEQNPPHGSWPVYSGKSFDIWDCDKNTYYAYIDPEIAKSVLNSEDEAE